MSKALDLTNQKFGRLKAIKKAPSRGGKTYWLCECECGNTKEVQTSHLTNHKVQSCGCLQKEKRKTGKKVVNFRIRVKTALVEANNHRCACCGLEDDQIVYDFHHLNPKEKSFGIGNGSTTRSKQSYADEAKKCIMVCANCHRKIEKGLIPRDNLQIIFDEKKYFSILESLI